MRTSVTPDPLPEDPDDQDEWPGSFGTVDEDGTLNIVDFESGTVEDTYPKGTWTSFTVTC